MHAFQPKMTFDREPFLMCLCAAVLTGGLGCSQVDRWMTPAPVPPLEHTPTAHAVPVAYHLPTDTADEQNGQAGDAEPEHLRDPLEPPYVLTVDNIIRLVYAKSPSVNAAREEMQAALYGLEEFRANLNRFEPFVDIRSDVSDFPKREGAGGFTGEATAGIQKETFEGAILRAEGGASFSRFSFDDRELPGDNVESGGGALIRARLEVPFFGSRRRQNRVISQAYQESTARKAKLDYLDNYRAYVENALSYYHLTVYYQRLASAYQRYVDVLESLTNDQRLKDEDRDRVESVRADNMARRDRYAANEREYLMTLLSESGISPEDDFELKIPPYRLSHYVMLTASPESLDRLLEEAHQNNPTFRVLNDAIRDAELQRTQAIKGKYDVTAFVEGTQFPLGSETFDDRLDGWTIGAGLTFRLNDHRVLNATRLKAEAQIRQFRARADAEEVTMRRRIITETEALEDNDKQRNNLLNVIEQKQAEFARRLKDYFQDQNDIDIDRVLSSRREVVNAEVRLSSTQYNSGNREARLMGATGRVYEIVGLKIGDDEDPRPSN